MYHNRAIPEVRYRVETEATWSDYTTAATVGQSGQRTVEGAVMMTVAPVAVVVAASYPAAVAVIIAAAIGIFAAIKYVRRDVPPDDSTQRSHYGKSDQDRSVSSSD